MALRARLALLVALLALPIQLASAQSFLESLFGSDEPASPRPAEGYVRQKPTSSFDRLFSPSEYDTPQPYVRGTTYRTLCVRMCDGFYFPISFATSSANFERDAQTCSASCGGDARLFYHPGAGGNIEGMLDLTGRAYAFYPTAFKYRKMLVQGCQCRPQPWTEAEQARHRAYAAMQASVANAQPGTPAPLPAIDGKELDVSSQGVRTPYPAFNTSPGYSSFSAEDDVRAVARPEPVYRQSPAGQWGWFTDTGPVGQTRSRYERPGTR